MKNQTPENMLCLTGHFSYVLTRYFSIPMIFILIASSPFIIIGQEAVASIKLVFAIILSICILCCGFYLFLKFKKLHISISGIYSGDVEIPWNEINKIYYPWMRPQMIIVKYKGKAKTGILMSVLPFFERDKYRALITNLENKSLK